MKNFETRLKGGHPNSLGNTIEVVEEVLKEPARFDFCFTKHISNE